MANTLFYSVLFGIATLANADPFYGQNIRKEVLHIASPGNCTAQSQVPNDTLKILVDRFVRDRNWVGLKSELKDKLNTNSSAYNQALSISDEVQYPLEQMSSSAGYLELLSILLDGGLGLDMVAGPNNWTMLHFSAEHGILSVAELLLARGANPNVRTSTQDTPIIIAAWRNHLPVVKALDAHGSDLNSQNEDGRTALHRAAYWGNADVVKYLVDSCADVTVTTRLGNTPLDDARSRGYTAIAQMLSGQRSC